MPTTPVTPDIGTTISEGYSRGLERAGRVIAAMIVPIVLVALVYGLAGWLQARVIADNVDDVVASLLSNKSPSLSFGDRALYGLIAAVAAIVSSVVGVGLMVVVAGAFHRERHGGTLELPSAGASIGAVWSGFQLLLPKYWIIVLLTVVGPAASILSLSLGSFVRFVASVVSIWLVVRWIYAPVIAGSGEAVGDAAIARSEAMVDQAWWRTFGIYIIVSLATVAPAAVVGLIAAAILGSLLGPLAFGITVLLIYLALVAILSAALESAWHQVESATQQPSAEPPAAPQDEDDPYA